MLARNLNAHAFWTQRPNMTQVPEYFHHYWSKVPEGINLVEALEQQELYIIEFFRSLQASQLDYAYAEGKWTPKQILLHIIDCERVFAYRILTAARQSHSPLPGFDHDYWANHTDVSKRDLNSLLVEFQSVRSNTLHLIDHLEEQQLHNCILREGQEVSLIGICGIVYGHPMHHIQIIQERYN